MTGVQTCALPIYGITPPGVCPANNTDNDKLIWITSTPKRGNFNAGLGVADMDCNDGADPNMPADIGTATYKALLVDTTTRRATTSGTDATGQLNWVLQPNTEYYLKTGGNPYTTAVLTTDANALFSFGSLSTALSGGADSFWTGLNSDWTTAANHCAEWTNDTAGFIGQYGNGGTTGASAISAGNSSCADTRKLICVQQ